MKKLFSVAAIALIAGLGTVPAAHAKLINFAVSVLDGAALGYTGASLDKSTAFNFDGASLLVSSTGAGDQSGLVAFPGTPSTVSLLPTNVMYGSGTGGSTLPGGGIVKSWTGADGDVFTETLTTILSINRATANAITVDLLGTVTDTFGLWNADPVQFIFSANQVGGPRTAISAGFTNTTTGVPETSTWVMMGLGFVGLGYAAVRRSSKDRSALPV
jgi:hypothetical protein